MDNFPLWIDHIAAVLLGIILPVFLTWKNRKGNPRVIFSSRDKKRIYLSGSFSLFLMGSSVILIWLIFQRPFSALGFKQAEHFNSWWWLVLVFLILFLFDSLMAVTGEENKRLSIEHMKTRTPFLPSVKSELPLYTLMCLSAGVFEELVYRGFLITYCLQLFADFNFPELWAIVLPGLVFSAAHFYQGSKAVIKIFVFSVFFGFIFIMSESLLLVVILHFLVDLIGGIITMNFLQNREDQLM